MILYYIWVLSWITCVIKLQLGTLLDLLVLLYYKWVLSWIYLCYFITVGYFLGFACVIILQLGNLLYILVLWYYNITTIASVGYTCVMVLKHNHYCRHRVLIVHNIKIDNLEKDKNTSEAFGTH